MQTFGLVEKIPPSFISKEANAYFGEYLTNQIISLD